jgi:hypothetical protein
MTSRSAKGLDISVRSETRFERNEAICDGRGPLAGDRFAHQNRRLAGSQPLIACGQRQPKTGQSGDY